MRGPPTCLFRGRSINSPLATRFLRADVKGIQWEFLRGDVARDIEAIDHLLAAALHDRATVHPLPPAARANPATLIERIHYHGVVGLLGDRIDTLGGWPATVFRQIREDAVTQAMWELRHRQLITGVLAALYDAGISTLLLKGTAIAYDLYTVPATRTRGDTDLLIDPRDVGNARAVLETLGFQRMADIADDPDGYALQEVWSFETSHSVDLHWQILNSPALRDVLPLGAAFAERIALPALSPHAFAMERVAMLIHACIHRSMHFTAPYFVDGREYFGGDRLIWLYDIHLLARTLSPSEWIRLRDMAETKGLAAVCLDGLLAAQHFLATPLPHEIVTRLSRAKGDSSPAFLRSRQLGRAWEDLKAVPGLQRKMGYFKARLLPPASFIRDKYPSLASQPLPLLYVRRLINLIRPRSGPHNP